GRWSQDKLPAECAHRYTCHRRGSVQRTCSMPISTSDLSRMPDIESLRRILRAVSMMEFILDLSLGDGMFPEHQFKPRWWQGVDVASWDNQQGDNYFVVFDKAGCWLRGFAHEAETSPVRRNSSWLPSVFFKGMPAAFERW